MFHQSTKTATATIKRKQNTINNKKNNKKKIENSLPITILNYPQEIKLWLSYNHIILYHNNVHVKYIYETHIALRL